MEIEIESKRVKKIVLLWAALFQRRLLPFDTKAFDIAFCNSRIKS